jgi:hypothetical protein
MLNYFAGFQDIQILLLHVRIKLLQSKRYMKGQTLVQGRSFQMAGYALRVLFVLLLLVSCGKKEVKPVSPESKIAQEAFQLAEKLKEAYINKDKAALEENTTTDSYKELTAAIRYFDKADLTFTPTWVEIKDSAVSLTVSWKGTWTVGGKMIEERGLAIFILEGQPLKLAQVKRENPFSQPE